jgi:hypothetical protein
MDDREDDSATPEERFKDTSDALEARFKAGTEAALARMILQCAATSQPMPAWAADAYVEGFTAILYGKLASWDDVFGRAHPKGRHRKSVQIDLMAHEVYCQVCNIDNVLFERVGRKLGVGGKSTVARLYARVKRGLDGHHEN